jgi:hypothetical protein
MRSAGLVQLEQLRLDVMLLSCVLSRSAAETRRLPFDASSVEGEFRNAVLGSSDDKPIGGGVMTRRVLVCSFVFGVITTAAAYAQAPGATNRAAIEKQIVANERAINEAVAKGDMKTFHSIVAADAAGVDTAGITRVNAPDFDKMMQSAKIQSWNIDGSQFYWVDDNTVVHMYRWTGKGTFGGQPVPARYGRQPCGPIRAGKWVAVFHQETVAMAAPTPAPAPAKK